MAVRLQFPTVWKRESGSQTAVPRHLEERESGSQTAVPRHLEERESGSQTAVLRRLEERESGSQTAVPRRLDCRGSSITLLCDQNYTVSGQRAKEEGGGEISPPPLPSSAESETVRQSDKETSVSTTQCLAREQRRKEEERSVLLHCRTQQGQRQSDSQTRRHQSPLHGVWPESEGGRRRRDQSSSTAKLSKARDSRTVRQGDIGLHCPVSGQTDREGRSQKERESAESRFSFTV